MSTVLEQDADGLYIEMTKIWKLASTNYDMEGYAACVIKMLQVVQAEGCAEQYENLTFLDNKVKVLVYAALEAIFRHDGQLAIYYLGIFREETIGSLNCLPDYRFWYGRASYEQRDWEKASAWFYQQVGYDAKDELAWFFLGNSCMKQGKFMDAISAYVMAMDCNPYFSEATVNAAVILRQIGERESADGLLKQFDIMVDDMSPEIIEYPEDQQLNLLVQLPERCYDIPIFINSRDRLICLKKLIKWLCTAGYMNIVILDNASTYPPLLEYYQEISNNGIRVLYLQENLGHKAIWEADVLHKMHIRTPYVYTDSDVLPGVDCRPDIVYYLLQLLIRYPWAKKAGPALSIEDITFYDREWVQEQEAVNWLYPVAKDIFAAPIDTTFAVYRPYYRYTLQEAVRVGGRCTFQHLPWYYSYQHLPADERYYLDHAAAMSTIATRYRCKYC